MIVGRVTDLDCHQLFYHCAFCPQPERESGIFRPGIVGQFAALQIGRGAQAVGVDIGHVQQVVIRHAGKLFNRQHVQRFVLIGHVFGREQCHRHVRPHQRTGRVIGPGKTLEQLVRVGIGEGNMDHLGPQPGRLGLAEAPVRCGCGHDVPVALVCQVQGEVLEHDAVAQRLEQGGEVHVVVQARLDAADHGLEAVGPHVVVTDDQVPAAAAQQNVVPFQAEDEIVTRPAVDVVGLGAAVKPVGTITAEDFQGRDQPPLLEVSLVNSPLPVRVGEDEPGCPVHHIVAVLRVDHRPLDVNSLIEQVRLFQPPVEAVCLAAVEKAQFALRHVVGADDVQRAVAARRQPVQYEAILQQRGPYLVSQARSVQGSGEVCNQVGGTGVGTVVDVRRINRGAGRQGDRRRRATVDDQRERRVASQLSVIWCVGRGEQDVRFGDELLVVDVPDQAGELVAMEGAVVVDRHLVRNGPTQMVAVAAQEQYAVLSLAAVKVVDPVGHECFVRSFQQWQAIGDQLERVVPFLTEQQVGLQLVQPAAEHIVARSGQDPVLGQTAREDVVARTADNDVPPVVVLARGQIHFRRRLPVHGEDQVVDGRNPIRRFNLDEVGLRRVQTAECQFAACPAEVEQRVSRPADRGTQLVAARLGPADLDPIVATRQSVQFQVEHVCC